MGLSPRVRGNPELQREYVHWRWSIPACAGEPSAWPPRPAFPMVYPRVCGGTSVSDLRPEQTQGLSPRVRGNQSDIHRRHHWPRSIPACAGEPDASVAWWSASRVYPRVCGGTSIKKSIDAKIKGLSRVCGGTLFSRDGKTYYRGLSPRVRGNHHRAQAQPPEDKTMKVYPRVCGGTGSSVAVAPTGKGLSPRVRGNPRRGMPHLFASWSIPACAGEPVTPGTKSARR